MRGVDTYARLTGDPEVVANGNVEVNAGETGARAADSSTEAFPGEQGLDSGNFMGSSEVLVNEEVKMN